MNETLYLHIPTYKELWYREKILQDPDTMRYNKGYDVFDGYDPGTGCIAFPEQEWSDWYAYFIGQEPQRFYAYIVRKADGAFLGEVNVHKNPNAAWHEMGIVLEAVHRGKGYAEKALWLLLQHAFESMNVEAIHNCFEADRTAAIRTHLAVGFANQGNKNGMCELLLSREQYFRQKTIRSATSDPAR